MPTSVREQPVHPPIVMAQDPHYPTQVLTLIRVIEAGRTTIMFALYRWVLVPDGSYLLDGYIIRHGGDVSQTSFLKLKCKNEHTLKKWLFDLTAGQFRLW